MKSIIAILFAFPLAAIAQQWAGSATVDGDINRTGNIRTNGLSLGRYGGSIVNDSNPYVIYSADGESHDLLVYGNSATTLHMRLYDGDLKFGTNSIPATTIFNNGNASFGGRVGFGIASPTADMIDVNGSARFRRQGSATAGIIADNGELTLLGWGVNNPYIQWKNSDNTRQGYMGWNTNRLSLVLENGYNFTVENGNMGIGTATPDAKLAVKGTIHSQEVKVDMLGSMVPDYVFEPSYTLPSLESIKTYIDQNKHLPEVPSAQEMEANGLNLGEMNMLLLKKVEELTLHLINQQKEIDELKKKLENK